jgi:hypothetical protein
MLRSAAALGAYEQKEKPINANASPRFRQGCRKQPRWRAPRAGPEDLAATASTFACLRASASSILDLGWSSAFRRANPAKAGTPTPNPSVDDAVVVVEQLTDRPRVQPVLSVMRGPASPAQRRHAVEWPRTTDKTLRVRRLRYPLLRPADPTCRTRCHTPRRCNHPKEPDADSSDGARSGLANHTLDSAPAAG